MRHTICTALFAIPLILAVAGCSESPGEISRDSEPFDGISATATIDVGGTEPFWGLAITPVRGGYEAKYASPELPGGATFPVSRFAGNNGLGFSGEWSGAPVNLALTPGECSDGMSERSYPYTATLQLDEVTLFGCAHTSDEPFKEGEVAP